MVSNGASLPPGRAIPLSGSDNLPTDGRPRLPAGNSLLLSPENPRLSGNRLPSADDLGLPNTAAGPPVSKTTRLPPRGSANGIDISGIGILPFVRISPRLRLPVVIVSGATPFEDILLSDWRPMPLENDRLSDRGPPLVLNDRVSGVTPRPSIKSSLSCVVTTLSTNALPPVEVVRPSGNSLRSGGEPWPENNVVLSGAGLRKSDNVLLRGRGLLISAAEPRSIGGPQLSGNDLLSADCLLLPDNAPLLDVELRPSGSVLLSAVRLLFPREEDARGLARRSAVVRSLGELCDVRVVWSSRVTAENASEIAVCIVLPSFGGCLNFKPLFRGGVGFEIASISAGSKLARAKAAS